MKETNWGSTTNPDQHDTQNFRYLVHAINPASRVHMNTLAAQEQIRSEITKSLEGDQSINLSQSPEGLSGRIALSMSLIDQNHTGTWGQAGLIVGVPSANLLMGSNHDIGAHLYNRNLLIRQAQNMSVPAPEDILRQTGRGSYNEIIAYGSAGTSRLELAGFFAKTTETKDFLDEDLAQLFKGHAERLRLPFVTITEPNPYKKEYIREHNEGGPYDKGGITVYFEGRVYYLFVLDKFWVRDQRDFSFFPSPDEVVSVLGYLRDKGFSQKKVDELAQLYHQADDKRKIPSVIRENGFGIVAEEGYGKDAIRTAVYSNDVIIERLEDRQRKLRRIFTNPLTPVQLRDPQYIDPEEFMSMAQDAFNTVPEDDAEDFRKWYESVLQRLLEGPKVSSKFSEPRGIHLSLLESPNFPKISWERILKLKPSRKE